MIKNIAKSAVWKKSFPVYKKFTVTKSDYEVISGSLETGSFDTGSFNKQGNILIQIHLIYLEGLLILVESPITDKLVQPHIFSH